MGNLLKLKAGHFTVKLRLLLLVCLICFVCLMCACGGETIDTVNTDGASENIGGVTVTGDTDSDYEYNTPNTYFPTETDDPNVFIEIIPTETGGKWGDMNIKTE